MKRISEPMQKEKETKKTKSVITNNSVLLLNTEYFCTLLNLEIFKITNLKPTVVDSIDEIIEQLKNQEYAIIIIDFKLNSIITGIELAEQIRKMKIQSKIILQSSVVLNDFQINNIKQLDCEYILKPIEIETFISILKD